MSLFNTSVKPVIIEVAEEAKPSIAYQIHQEVYSAQENILAEANRILNTQTKYSKEQREIFKELAKLGFENAEVVRDFKNSDVPKQEDLIKKIEEYKVKYPLHKFIDEKTVKTICSKYDLSLAWARNYIAEIPEKCQKSIIAFRVQRGDKRSPQEMLNQNSFYLIDGYGHAIATELIPGNNLLVMAPDSKLNTEGQIKDGHVLKNDDPIVLQPVKEGYLIVTSWGLEASDPMIVNEINN